MPEKDLDAALDRLYSVPLEEFTAARGEAAKELAARGDREGAAALRRVRKPTVAAWAVNQLRRRDGAPLDRFFEHAKELESAQHALISEGDRERFTRADEQYRRALKTLTDRAVAAAEKRGAKRTAQLAERIEGTLAAAAADPDVRDQVLAGRLERERPAPSGVGGLSDLPAATAGRQDSRRSSATSKAAGVRKRLERERARAKKAEEDLRHAEQGLEEAHDLQRAAERAVRREKATVRNAKAALARATERVAKLERELESA